MRSHIPSVAVATYSWSAVGGASEIPGVFLPDIIVGEGFKIGSSKIHICRKMLIRVMATLEYPNATADTRCNAFVYYVNVAGVQTTLMRMQCEMNLGAGFYGNGAGRIHKASPGEYIRVTGWHNDGFTRVPNGSISIEEIITK